MVSRDCMISRDCVISRECSGTAQSVEGSEQCAPCRSGTYQDITGQTRCKTCLGTVNSDRTTCQYGGWYSLVGLRKLYSDGVSVKTLTVPCERSHFKSSKSF